MTTDFVWAFNLKVFIQAYKDLGYSTQLDDWNVRVNGDGEIRLDNTYTKTTTAFIVDDSVLFVEVSPWNLEVASPNRQNVDLLQTNYGWRNDDLEPVRDPSPEAIAFLNHLSDLGYYPMKVEGEYEDDDLPDNVYQGMTVQNMWGADC